MKLIGYASGMAANRIDCALGPWYLYYHQQLFSQIGFQVEWEAMIQAASPKKGMDVLPLVMQSITELGLAVLSCVKKNKPFCVFGGDHSCAMGTWNAVAHAERHRGDIGLLWIDAHMDCHTPETSKTKNIHGMPLAHLLGQGHPDLINLFENKPALRPENVCLIGIRSYQPEEKAMLDRLGVTVFYMDDIKTYGLDNILKKAYAHVSQSTCGVGISLDLDAIDPGDAPGVSCPARHGISGTELVGALRNLILDKNFLGLELAEYNPMRDIDNKTTALMMDVFASVYKKHQKTLSRRSHGSTV
ncbi:MAG: arginase [Legionellaceae bacterium]|nr:arginase [Legionellaceae bacterium]